MLLPASHHRWFFVSCSFAGFYRGSKVSTVEVQMCVDDFSERYIYESIIKKLAPKKTYFAIRPQKDTKGPVQYGALIFRTSFQLSWHCWCHLACAFSLKSWCSPEPWASNKSRRVGRGRGRLTQNKQNWAPFDMNFYMANTSNVCKVESIMRYYYSI